MEKLDINKIAALIKKALKKGVHANINVIDIPLLADTLINRLNESIDNYVYDKRVGPSIYIGISKYLINGSRITTKELPLDIQMLRDKLIKDGFVVSCNISGNKKDIIYIINIFVMNKSA